MSKLKKSADEAFAKILEFAADESVGEKTRLDLYKWICEMYYALPRAAVSSAPNLKESLTNGQISADIRQAEV